MDFFIGKRKEVGLDFFFGLKLFPTVTLRTKNQSEVTPSINNSVSSNLNVLKAFKKVMKSWSEITPVKRLSLANSNPNQESKEKC